MLSTENEALNSLIRTDFYSFFHKVFSEATGGETFIPNWHLEVLSDALEKCRTGEIKRLIINVPPRSGKSLMFNVSLPAWILGKSPSEKIICTSYSQELSEKFARDTKNVIQSSWYKTAFPTTRLSKDRHSAYDFNTTKRGGRFSTSIEGTLTGRGGNWIIIDDPIKPDDAFSDLKLNKVISWYKNTLLSRLDDKNNGVIIVIMQRVHENDLTGYLLSNSEGWHHIKMPAIAEEDEEWLLSDGKKITRKTGVPLCSARESLSFLNKCKIDMGEFTFSGQYQQNPVPLEGGLVKSKWLQYYGESELPNKFDYIIQSWDTASKAGENNAYSACSVLGVVNNGYNNKYYLLEVFRERLETPDLLEKIISLRNEYEYKHTGYIEVLIEDHSSGTYLLQEINRDYKFGFEAIAIKPDKDKVSRMKGASIKIERKDVWFPLKEWSWWSDFEKELLTFPKSKYKDQVDSLSQALNHESDYRDFSGLVD